MPHDNSISIETQEGFPNEAHRAEVYSYQPTTKERQGRLIGVYLSGAGIYPGEPFTPRSQEEQVLFRIGRGKGGPVELPRIQQDENGRGFISQFTARVHALKHRHGFRIKNRVDYSTDPVGSWYWCEVNSSGIPLLNDVPLTASRNSKPKASVSAPAPAKKTVGRESQIDLFRDSRRWSDPEMAGRG